jgi:hypothetical protein
VKKPAAKSAVAKATAAQVAAPAGSNGSTPTSAV